MSFLWRSSVDSSANLCKSCTEKDKRIQDYDVFFNETKDVLKTKDERYADIQIKLAERISEIELLKKSYESEKRQWMEDRKIWQEFNKKYQNEAIEWELEKSKYEELLEEMNNQKMFSARYQKTLEDKISNLIHSLDEADLKYQDLVQRVTEQNILQSDELREREEDIISVYEKKIEEIVEEFDEKENEMLAKHSDYEVEIQRLEESNLELSIRIQEMKYDQECITEKYEQQIKDSEEKWETRISVLNETYDSDFIHFKQHFKEKEEMIENQKTQLIHEIEKLKTENELLEEAKNHNEKKIAEIHKQNKVLKDNNQKLEMDFYDEQKQTEILKNEKSELQHELATNKKILDQQMNLTENRSFLTNQTVNLDMDSEQCSNVDFHEDERRKKKRTNKKRNTAPVPVPVQVSTQNGSDLFSVPYVEAMNKNEEKKTDFTKTDYSKHYIIDIVDDQQSTSNFFLPRQEPFLTTQDVLYEKMKRLEQQVKVYEQEMEKLKIENSEFVNKIKSYECNSILQLNRNLRSGIPVRFFPYHTNLSPIQSTSSLSNNQFIHNTID